jgi:hypothetical protein
MTAMSNMRAGDWVEVRSKDEILRTLDKNGRLEGLPFMPQMFRYCGQRFQVYKRAHKTCDTVSGEYITRRLPDGIHLDLRCDGAEYGGCQAACLIYWKEAWLKPVGDSAKTSPSGSSANVGAGSGCTEQDVWNARRATDESRYFCQATELLDFTTPIRWWQMSQYVEDYTSGNTSLMRIFCGSIYACYSFFAKPGRFMSRQLRWLYNRFQALYGGVPFPRLAGDIPAGELTPTEILNLKAGELVRVKPFEDILATLDTAGKNRGLYFDAEMVPFCGQTFRVRSRVTTFINEKTGALTTLKSPTVILDGACCQSRYSHNRMYCPRAILAWWREIWLERVPEESAATERAPRLAAQGAQQGCGRQMPASDGGPEAARAGASSSQNSKHVVSQSVH